MRGWRCCTAATGRRVSRCWAFRAISSADRNPATRRRIASFCSLTYDVTFTVFARIDVNGDQAEPLFRDLKRAAPGLLGSKAIKWNFTKFLVDRSGQVVSRHAPTTKPAELAREIEALL